MPYIHEGRRINYDHALNLLWSDMEEWPPKAGDLNYIITRIIIKYLGALPNYQRYSDVVGVLECAKLELYRRKVSPYEDTKILANGNVF